MHTFHRFLIGVISVLPTSSSNFLLPAYCSQQDGFIEVVQNCTLPKRGLPYTLAGIYVSRGVVLTIEPGVNLYFQPNADVTVDGSLIAVGSEQEPIRFLAASDPWQGIKTQKTTDAIHLEYVEVSDFLAPLQMVNSRFTLRHLTLTDGQENVLKIDLGDPYFGGTLPLDSLTFQNKQLGNAMGSNGLQIHGSFDQVILTHISILDNRSVLNDMAHVGMEGGGQFNQLTTHDIHFPGGCNPSIPASGAAFRVWAIPQQCAPQKDIPIVFIPGFGGSINLVTLLQPKPQEVLKDGWHSIRLLTPSYARFIDTARANGIPVMSAYYDWRQTAQDGVRDYLLPAIAEAKRVFKTDTVNIVSHSYGGILARSYIQSELYQGDVANFIELGTPNAGLIEAYGAWEGAQAPADWEAMYHLLTYYKYVTSRKKSDQQLVREIFPSIGQLLPTYSGALIRAGGEAHLCTSNSFLEILNKQSSSLFERTHVFLIGGTARDTPISLSLGDAHCNQEEWPDGAIYQQRNTVAGDGTVPLESIKLGQQGIRAIGSDHVNLPGDDVLFILQTLYHLTQVKESTLIQPLRHGLISFLLDCPVVATITAPDGTVVRSDVSQNTDSVAVENTPELTWVLLPRQEGKYMIMVHAKADTPMRMWVNRGTPILASMKKDQEISWQVDSNTDTITLIDAPTPSVKGGVALMRHITSSSATPTMVVAVPKQNGIVSATKSVTSIPSVVIRTWHVSLFMQVAIVTILLLTVWRL
jgi:hypothetical protein